jgi:hypothetical protein
MIMFKVVGMFLWGLGGGLPFNVTTPVDSLFYECPADDIVEGHRVGYTCEKILLPRHKPVQ